MLMRTDPFRELDRLSQQFFGTNGTSTRPAVMPMDAYRDGERYVVHFDIPGVDPSSIDLDVERRGAVAEPNPNPLRLRRRCSQAWSGWPQLVHGGRTDESPEPHTKPQVT